MKSMHIALFAVVALTVNASADEPKPSAQPVRTIFERHDQSGVPGKEIVIGSAMLPAGTSIGYHTHPGDEAGYFLKGTLILKTRGQPARVPQPSSSFSHPPPPGPTPLPAPRPAAP